MSSDMEKRAQKNDTIQFILKEEKWNADLLRFLW